MCTVTLSFPCNFYHLECLVVLNYLYLLGSTGTCLFKTVNNHIPTKQNYLYCVQRFFENHEIPGTYYFQNISKIFPKLLIQEKFWYILYRDWLICLSCQLPRNSLYLISKNYPAGCGVWMRRRGCALPGSAFLGWPAWDARYRYLFVV